MGSKKVYVLYTHLNVDNYGRPLNNNVVFPTIQKWCTLILILLLNHDGFVLEAATAYDIY